MMINWQRTFQVVVFLCVGALAAMAIATEFVAWKLGFPAALGQPLIFLGKLPFYPPWRILDWLVWRNTVPAVKIGVLIGAAFAAVPFAALIFRLFMSPPGKSDFGAAEWGTMRDARRAGLIIGPPRGTVLGQTASGDLISYEGDEHRLVTGGAGSGKTVNQVMGTLLSWRESALVYDPKCELYDQTAVFRNQFGEAFYFDPTSLSSARFNPLWEIRTNTIYEIGDIQNLATILVDPGDTQESSKYWGPDASKLLTGLILFALHDLPREKQSLTTVNDMLLRIKTTLPLMTNSKHGKCRDIAEYFSGMADKQFCGVYGHASATLLLYNDPVISRNTNISDVCISDLVCSDYPMTLYLQVRPTDADRLRPLIRLILLLVAQALMYDTKLTADGRKKKHKLLYLLEEFPSLGKLDFFSGQMQVMRGYGITCMLIVQSFKSIINTYGTAQIIVDNCRIVISFAASDPDTQDMISTMIGDAIEKKESETRPRMGMHFFKGSKSTSTLRRRLLDPGQVRQIGYDEQIILVTGVKPFRTKKVRWFAHPQLATLGTNLERGGIKPGQNEAIVAMARPEPHPSIPEPEEDQKVDDTPPSQLSNLAQIVNLTGWSNTKTAKLLFPKHVNPARKWIADARPMPPEHEPFVAHVLNTITQLPEGSDVTSFLTVEVIERLRNGEIIEAASDISSFEAGVKIDHPELQHLSAGMIGNAIGYPARSIEAWRTGSEIMPEAVKPALTRIIIGQLAQAAGRAFGENNLKSLKGIREDGKP